MTCKLQSAVAVVCSNSNIVEPMEQDERHEDAVCAVLHKISSVAGDGIHAVMENLRHQLECRLGHEKLLQAYAITVDNLSKGKSLNDLKAHLDSQSNSNLPLLLNLAQLEILLHGLGNCQ